MLTCCGEQRREGEIDHIMKRIKKPRKKLKEARLKKGLTQKDLASSLGISRTFYNQIENGERSPEFNKAVEISNFLKLDIREWS